MCNENVTTVLCSSVGDFRIFDKNVIFVKRGIVGNALDSFILYLLTNFN